VQGDLRVKRPTLVLRRIAYVCRRLQVSADVVHRLMRSGELAYVNVASSTNSKMREARFRVEDVDDFISRRRVSAAAQTPRETQRPQLVRGGASRSVGVSLARSGRFS
jgi:predicted site-specific integrase-resolvase